MGILEGDKIVDIAVLLFAKLSWSSRSRFGLVVETMCLLLASVVHTTATSGGVEFHFCYFGTVGFCDSKQ